MRDLLERAVFWEEKICLDCGATAHRDADVCVECGGEDLADAALALKVLDLVERGEGE